MFEKAPAYWEFSSIFALEIRRQRLTIGRNLGSYHTSLALERVADKFFFENRKNLTSRQGKVIQKVAQTTHMTHNQSLIVK